MNDAFDYSNEPDVLITAVYHWLDRLCIDRHDVEVTECKLRLAKDEPDQEGVQFSIGAIHISCAPKYESSGERGEMFTGWRMSGGLWIDSEGGADLADDDAGFITVARIFAGAAQIFSKLQKPRQETADV